MSAEIRRDKVNYRRLISDALEQLPDQRGTKAEILQCVSLKQPEVLDKSSVAQIAQQLSKNFRSVPCRYALLPQPPDNPTLAKQ